MCHFQISIAKPETLKKQDMGIDCPQCYLSNIEKEKKKKTLRYALSKSRRS